MARTRTLIVALLGIEALATVPTAAMPPFLGLYVDRFGYSLDAAGRVASFETIGMAVGQLITAIWLARAGVNLRRAALIALLTFAVAQSLSLWPQMPVLFSTVRFLSGMAGGGLIFAIVGLYLASLPDPDRSYSLFYGMLFVVGPIGILVLPRVLESVSPGIVYLALAAAAILALPLLRVLPPVRSVAQPSTQSSPENPVPHAHRAIAGLLGASLFANYIGNGGVWVYMERIGEAFAIAPGPRGLYLSVGMAIGLLGTLAAIGAAGRLKRLHAILAGNAVLAIAYLVLIAGTTPPHYIAGAILQSVAVTFVTPFYLSALAGTDRVGRNLSIGLLAFGLGYGAGPAVLSMFATPDFHAALYAATATALIAVLLALAAMTIERRRAPSDLAPVLS